VVGRDQHALSRLDRPLQVLQPGHLDPRQPLFAQQTYLDALAEAMDTIDSRYGHHTIYFGGMWGALTTAPTRIAFTQIPRLEEFDR
jgi:hypothetical protein